MNKDVFVAVSDRVEVKVPALKWIDWDNGQIDNQTIRPEIACPACLIDIEYPTCADTGGSDQIVTANIILRIIFTPEGDTNNHSAVRNAALASLLTLETVHAALQGWSTSAMDKLSRTSAKVERRKDGLKVYRVIYQTSFVESV